MAIRGILFDKDGTLLDFGATWLPVLREAALVVSDQDRALADRLLEASGCNPRTGQVRAGSLAAAGNTAELCAAWAEHLPGGRRGSELTALVDRIFEEGGARHAAAVTDLSPLFRRLKARGLFLGVATNDSLGSARASLAGFAILEQLDFLAGYDSGYGVKPGPGMVLGFCAHVGLDPGSVAVVGDNTHDLEMGRRAGAGLTIGVLTGTGSRAELAALADHILVGIDDLEAVLPLQ